MFDHFKPAPPPRSDHVAVKPPRPVWVDLGAVYRVGRPRRPTPHGLDLQATVPGDLRLWAITTTGHWVGYVTFVIHDDTTRIATGQWVLADALRPRGDEPSRR
ncbi:hypothetical protein AB0I60_08215 [Actinosynnema sp. NPDC050436]|uniref:hypothetical protein n=1 Tax=Actinosynnema sp. NPDC050436 TaxID=3155659 RepID=UPI0033E947B4